jgi:hypothetical protein
MCGKAKATPDENNQSTISSQSSNIKVKSPEEQAKLKQMQAEREAELKSKK